MNTKLDLNSLIQFKPIEQIEDIFQKVSPFAEPFVAARGEILRYKRMNTHQCFLLHSGTVTLNRRGDGMVLNTEKAPFILGVSNQYSSNDNVYVKVVENSQLSRLSVERFNLLTESYNLWQSLCFVLIYNASRVFAHSTLISQMSSYDLIRFQLQQLMDEPERIRRTTTAANYIMNRTYLSRSGVMRILSLLRSEGYISLQRGILVKIQELPETLIFPKNVSCKEESFFDKSK
ncbi:helix-turn-helix domain-containing protein [Enterobacter cloacae complex sp. ECC445]|uniref:helix-turn-helix domain-containing protein n=1 Tax=Enterobacter cloacae complex sp. ECC445 TaxID=2913213 RepID=UPI001F424515|nr:helix-turn-helix domain-containing protein [Enterobacter cloacae complex sp. ECC445]MCG0457721.1 helix-turn-helix domain-containing protein [Enterobacter cloacae complex sp. ECC445]